MSFFQQRKLTVRQVFEFESRTDQLWQYTYERVIILTGTGVSLSPFIISSALILGDSERIRSARKFTKYGLIIVPFALAAFTVFYLWEVYSAREQVQSFYEEVLTG